MASTGSGEFPALNNLLLSETYHLCFQNAIRRVTMAKPRFSRNFVWNTNFYFIYKPGLL